MKFQPLQRCRKTSAERVYRGMLRQDPVHQKEILSLHCADRFPQRRFHTSRPYPAPAGAGFHRFLDAGGKTGAVTMPETGRADSEHGKVRYIRMILHALPHKSLCRQKLRTVSEFFLHGCIDVDVCCIADVHSGEVLLLKRDPFIAETLKLCLIAAG